MWFLGVWICEFWARNAICYYFNKKLNDAKQWYLTYEKELYTIIQSLRYWHHHLLSQEFVLHLDHEDFCFLNSQKNSWILGMVTGSNTCMPILLFLKHKKDVENQAFDALSHHISLLSIMSFKVIGFERLKEVFDSCLHFKEIFLLCKMGGWIMLMVSVSKRAIFLDPISCASLGLHCETL